LTVLASCLSLTVLASCLSLTVLASCLSLIVLASCLSHALQLRTVHSFVTQGIAHEAAFLDIAVWCGLLLDVILLMPVSNGYNTKKKLNSYKKLPLKLQAVTL
jgi:hypothetical protein